MELDRIYALAGRLRQRLHCSVQRAEYMASLLALAHTVSEDSFELLSEINAIHLSRNQCATRSGR